MVCLWQWWPRSVVPVIPETEADEDQVQVYWAAE